MQFIENIGVQVEGMVSGVIRGEIRNFVFVGLQNRDVLGVIDETLSGRL